MKKIRDAKENNLNCLTRLSNSPYEFKKELSSFKKKKSWKILQDKMHPKLLRKIKEAPEKLYYKGKWENIFPPPP